MTLKRALFILLILLIILGFGLGAYGFLVPGALPGWLWKPLTVAGTLGALAAALNAARQIFFGGKTLGELWRETAPGPRPSAPCQAPRPLPDFVGRTDEIRRLERALKPGARAAITGVVGMGGIGKTELAKIVAHRVAGRYRNGVLWADCGDERLTDVADRWATAYGVERLAGDDFHAKATSWRGLISGKEVLLVFDNVQPDQEVEPLFPPPQGRSTVLITTRHAHHPALRSIEPLRLDEFTPAEAFDLAELVLGRETARTQRAEADRLFELVGYLPLAVSIALHTAREKGWALAKLNRMLKEAGAIKSLDEPGLRKSLRATFQTAWDSLPGDLQRAFAALAVFNQGPSFHTTAMAAVLEAEEPDARALLHRLVGRSLLTQAGDGRWRLHPLLREFAAEKLPAGDPAWGRMAAHYVQMAGAADELYLHGGEDLLRGLALFDLEWPHIRAGQAWATSHAEADEKATQLCSDYPDAAAYCLVLRLHPREWAVWLEAAVTAARRLGDRAAKSWHLGNLGYAHYNLGEFSQAIEFCEQALEIAQEIGDRRNEGQFVGYLGMAYAALGEARRAIELYKRALGIAREIGDRRGEGNYLASLGYAYLALGETRRVIEYYQQALEIAHEIGERQGEGIALGSMGHAYRHLGETRQAIEFYEQALEIAREIRDRRNEGQWLGNLGLAYYDLGEVLQAIKYYEQALGIAREIGDRWGEENRLGGLGNAYFALGEACRAIEYYEQALEIAREIGERRGEGAHLGNLGLAYYDLGEVRKAIGYYEQALEIAREIEDRINEGQHLANMGQAYKRLGDTAKVRQLWEEALRIYEAIEDPQAKTVQEWLAELEGGR
ncbi:MAG: tetratricopeptide repeat protein [Anaerolineae bacterium]